MNSLVRTTYSNFKAAEGQRLRSRDSAIYRHFQYPNPVLILSYAHLFQAARLRLYLLTVAQKGYCLMIMCTPESDIFLTKSFMDCFSRLWCRVSEL